MFTAEARQAIVRAQDEAREMGHGTVDVEHLLLGLFSGQDGIAGPVFATVGLTVEPGRDLVRERLGVDSDVLPDQPLRFSDAARSCDELPVRTRSVAPPYRARIRPTFA